MAFFRFTGRNASGYTKCFGATFECDGEPVEVTDKGGVERLRKHPEFEEIDGRTKAAKAVKADAAE